MHSGVVSSHDSGVALHSGVVAGLIQRGAEWLAAHPNRDGGWGDTPASRSNISTTALVWAALNVAPATPATDDGGVAAATWLTREAGGARSGVAAPARSMPATARIAPSRCRS